MACLIVAFAAACYLRKPAARIVVMMDERFLLALLDASGWTPELAEVLRFLEAMDRDGELQDHDGELLEHLVALERAAKGKGKDAKGKAKAKGKDAKGNHHDEDGGEGKDARGTAKGTKTAERVWGAD